MVMVPLSISVSPEVKALLDGRARALGCSVSDVARTALEMHLAPAAALIKATSAAGQAEAERQRLADQIRVIADFVADHGGGDEPKLV